MITMNKSTSNDTKLDLLQLLQTTIMSRKGKKPITLEEFKNLINKLKGNA